MQRKQPAEKGASRGFTAFQASCLLCGLYIPSPFPPLVFAFIRNMRLAKPPANAPMGAAEDMSAASRHAISIPAAAPIAAEAATTVAKNTTMINAIPILRMIHSLKEMLFTRDQGLPSPSDKSRRKLVSIIQLIVRNVKRIFIRSYILQIAVLIAASGAFGDQIK